MRHLELTFASGESSLSVRRFRVHERVSTLFSVEVLARSPDPSVPLSSLVGRPAQFRLDSGYTHVRDRVRLFEGIVRFVQQVQAEVSDKGLSTYHVHIVPKLWLTTQRTNLRIFQHLTIPDIVDKILGEWHIEPTWKIDRGTYPKLEFKVQYEESDFTFMSRLLEEAGIAYVFDDANGTESKLVFSDALHHSPLRPGAILYVDNPTVAAEREYVTAVRLSHEVRPGAHAIRDTDFRRPAFNLLGEAPKSAAPEDRYEQFHYLPGAFLIEPGSGGDTPVADDRGVARHQLPFGHDRAERALLGDRAGREATDFTTNLTDLRPGTVFAIHSHPHPEIDGKGLLVLASTLKGTAEAEWTMHGNAVSSDVRYCPPFVTPRPHIVGVQTATVVGPRGQEIHTDEFGRVRVQLAWDREGSFDETSSCWIRVSQAWGGKGYGMITIPRIGQEVLVSFLDGNPDQPIVLNRVYNETQPVPYKLPDNKTVSTWKSDSSLGGDGLNEVKYEDKKGDELFYVQAEKNLRKLVKHDETITVLHDREKHVQMNELDTTDGNRTEVTDNHRVEDTKNDRTIFIGGYRKKLVKKDELRITEANRLLRVGKTIDDVVKGKKREKIHGDVHLIIKGNRSEQIDGKQSLTIFGDQHESVSGRVALQSGLSLHLAAAENLVGEAVSELTLKGPGGFVHIDATGVVIRGVVVDINVSGSPGIGGGSRPDPPEEPEKIQLQVKVTPRFIEVAVPIITGLDGEPSYPPENAKVTLRSNKGYTKTLTIGEAVRSGDGFCSLRFFGMDESMKDHLFTAVLRAGDYTETLFQDSAAYGFVEHSEKKGAYKAAHGAQVVRRGGT